uniref:uncharacterized protein LOC109953040 n=1 Tax=Monopterus albus TaxID=43700 RepID=UPI0009B382FD|nr:uncharacterized protein LOC109953040 [Monopterus albus]
MMFPSSGLFTNTNCPLSKRGRCERPHCFYKHAVTSKKSSIVESTGVRNGCSYASCKVSVNDESRDDCLQQLERINKEIESVRHEVEQERRRLSRYQTTQTDGNNSVPNLSVSNPETAGKNVDGSSHGLSSCTDFTKPYAQARKYVVDNSKPRTDLEYDPLSNFSADLRSYSSSGKEQKVKGQDLKRPRNTVTCNQEKPLPYQAPLSRSPSPEPLDDSYEDNILVIDIPPSPEKKRGRTQKLDCVSGKSQNGEEILNKVKTAPSLLDSTAELFKDKFASRFEANKVHNCDAENELGKDVVDLFKKKKCENIPADEKVIDLTGCLEDLESECQRITCLSAAERAVENNPQPTVLSATSDQQNHSCNKMAMEEEKNPFQIEFPQWELPHSVEKMNQLQPCDLPLKNFLFNKEPAANSDSPCRQHTAQAPTTELSAKGRVHNHCSPKQIIPSLVPDSQKPSQVQMQGKASISHTPSVMYQEQAEPGSSQFQAWHISSSAYSDLTNGAEPTEQILVKADDAVVIVDSSSDEDEEFTFRSKEVEAELSDSDPMEECYRIFMEANNEVKGHEEHSGVSDGATDVEKSEVNVKPQVLPGKKRVAHEAKHTEQPVAKSRPQPQVLVPLRGLASSGFGSQPSTTSKMQQVQQKASILTASLRSGQAFVSSTCQKKPETQTAPSPSTQTLKNLQPAPVQGAYMNYIPFGTAVIDMGSNLHLILPESSFSLPVSSSSSPITSILTPITPVHPSTVAVIQTQCSPAVTPVQRYRTTAPVLIPALARKPFPVPTKRKVKQQCEAAKDKVPHDVRQRYVSLFTEEFRRTTASVNDAFEKALAEERTIYSRSVNKLKYLSVAVNALKRLKNQNTVAAKVENEVNHQKSKGNVPLNWMMLKGNDDVALYESLKDYILTEERLIESNYPVQHPEKPGCAALFADNKKGSTDPLKRLCCRCGTTFSVSQTGKHIRKEECNYHYGKGVENRVAAAKPVPTKRKVKQQCEAAKDKVPHDVRQRYVSLFTEEFRRTTASVNDAFEKALAEERTIYSRSVNKLKYLSVAVNALKRLKNQNTVAAKVENEVNHQKSKGNVPLNWMMLKGNDDVALYESLKDYILTEERLIESNYPVQHPEKPGCAALFADNKKGSTDPLKRLCCRCGTTFSVSQTGKHIRKEECNYHYGKGVENRVPGGVETRYSCCEGDMGAPGCQVFRLHVHNSLSLDGFVSTGPRQPSDTSCPGVYSLDCEMCYTIHGLELSRVTVVNSSLQVIYDTFVRPDNEVVDYDTRFSGISEEDVKGNHTSLREVQKTLLGFISADTILIGHGLEADLCALKLLHGTVVDTSAVFPHRLGPPHKLTLNNLTADYLRRIIQESVCGHDTAEDAAACMELMLWKVKEDGKMKNDGNKTKK